MLFLGSFVVRCKKLTESPPLMKGGGCLFISWLRPFSGGAGIDGPWCTTTCALAYGKAHQQSCWADMRKHTRWWAVCARMCACVWGAIISSSVTREGGGGWREGQRDRSDNRLSDSDKLSSNGSACRPPVPPPLFRRHLFSGLFHWRRIRNLDKEKQTLAASLSKQQREGSRGR